MPIEKKYNIDELKKALLDYIYKKRDKSDDLSLNETTMIKFILLI